MAIKITDKSDVHMTSGRYRKLLQEYNDMCKYYCGLPPSFEEYCKRRLDEGTAPI